MTSNKSLTGFLSFLCLRTGYLAGLLCCSPGVAGAELYANFPVTIKGYSGSMQNSESYSGQVARHLLHESLKKLAGEGDGNPNPALKARMHDYYTGKDEGRVIVAPRSDDNLVFLQSGIDEISKGKNLAEKIYRGTVTSWPGNFSGSDVVGFWIDKASAATKGYDYRNGYNYPQLISKFILGAVFLHQIARIHLDEELQGDKYPNSQPYQEGTAFTAKEHVWDAAFGYFGAAANTATLTAKQSYEVAKIATNSDPASALELADYNHDGKVDYAKEMTFALAYYASSYDKDGKTDYLRTVNQAFLNGRKLLASANGEKLSDAKQSQLSAYARIVKKNLQLVLAESVFKYAGETYEDLRKLQVVLDSGGDPSKVIHNYTKHWAELKGFSMALQIGDNNLGETESRLNWLIGFGPALANTSQVVDIDSAGNYIKDQGPGLGEYALHMLKVQKLMMDQFAVTARSHDQLSNLATLTESLGGANSAEND